MSQDAASRTTREFVAALNEVLQALQNQPLSDEAVHTVRKDIKRARAALRLLREPLGEKIYTRGNTGLRDAGRCLAPVRDAKSLGDAYEEFRDRYSSHLQGATYDALATQLQARLDDQRRELDRAKAMLQKCIRLIAACRDQRKQWRIGAVQAVAVPAGLQRIFRKGRKAYALAKQDHSPAALHEWRKQVKYLSNALKVLDGSGPEPGKLAKQSDKLADQLGEDHDLAELLQFLCDPQAGLAASQRSEMASLIEGRRTKLQKKAEALGTRIYGQKPGHFLRQLTENKHGRRVVKAEDEAAAAS